MHNNHNKCSNDTTEKEFNHLTTRIILLQLGLHEPQQHELMEMPLIFIFLHKLNIAVVSTKCKCSYIKDKITGEILKTDLC